MRTLQRIGKGVTALMRRIAIWLVPLPAVRNRFLHGSLWSLSANTISQALRLATFIVAAQLLGKAQFGRLGIVIQTVLMFCAFAGAGITTTATRFVAIHRSSDPTKTGRILGLLVVTATGCAVIAVALLVCLAPTLATHVLRSPETETPLRLAGVLVLTETLCEAQISVLYGFEAFRAVTMIRLVRGIAGLIFLTALTLWDGLNGGLIGLIIAACCGLFLATVRVHRCYRASGISVCYRGIGRELPMLWRFALPSLLASSFTTPAIWLTSALLVRQAGGMSEMGAFNAAYQWRALVIFIPAVLARVNVPLLSSLFGKGDLQACRVVMLATLRISALVVIPVAVAICCFAEPIMHLYGKDFCGSGQVLRLIVVTAALLSVQLPVSQIITASGHMWFGALMTLGWAITLVGFTHHFVQRGMGAEGLAVSHLLAYLLLSMWTVAYAIKKLGRKAGATREDL